MELEQEQFGMSGTDYGLAEARARRVRLAKWTRRLTTLGGAMVGVSLVRSEPEARFVFAATAVLFLAAAAALVARHDEAVRAGIQRNGLIGFAVTALWTTGIATVNVVRSQPLSPWLTIYGVLGIVIVALVASVPSIEEGVAQKSGVEA